MALFERAGMIIRRSAACTPAGRRNRLHFVPKVLHCRAFKLASPHLIMKSSVDEGGANAPSDYFEGDGERRGARACAPPLLIVLVSPIRQQPIIYEHKVYVM